MHLTRRGILGAGTGTAVLATGAALFWPRGAAFDFEAVPGLPGFRRLAGQSVAAGSFSTSFGADPDAGAALAGTTLCDVAFGGKASGPGALIIASFSDFFCPYCRVLDEKLHDLAKDDPRISIIWHQVPLLGLPSRLAARGALAARVQGAFRAYQQRLLRTSFVPNRAYLEAFAVEAGLDVSRFLNDLDAPWIDAGIAASTAAFRAFGFIGTPGLAMGRTLINGAISPRDLRRLAVLEIDGEAPDMCGV